MATLTERTHVVEERTDRLETVFAAFMARTDESIARLERIIERREQDGAREREAAARERDREESARYLEEAARERRERNKRWCELVDKWSTVVEDIVAPSVRRLAPEVFDCGRLQYFATRVSCNRKDDLARGREFDALYVGTRAVLLNDTKSSPRINDARRFARFVESGQFARYFPQYRDLPIVPVFSSLSIPEDMVEYLTGRGIYVLAMGDEDMQVLNLEAVRGQKGDGVGQIGRPSGQTAMV